MILKRNLLVTALASAGLCMAFGVQAATGDTGAQATAGSSQQASTSGSGTDQTSAAATSTTNPKSQQQLAKSLSTVTVTGFSASVEKSVDYQRYADTIQNVVTAADIGGLPDQSIADSLTHLPGVSTERIAGMSSQINIRGLSGDFIETTLDGREQPSTSGTNYIQFDQYPSELINMATVYKTSQASLIEGGVAGTIALQTANPLENTKDQSLNIDTRGSYNDAANNVPNANAMGYRLSVAYQGKFLDNTLGVGLGFADMYQPHVSEQFVGEASDGALYTLANGKQAYLPEGLQVQQNGGEERRRGYLGTVVWRPTDELQVTADTFFSKFDNSSYGFGFRSQNYYGGNATITNPVLTYAQPGQPGTVIGGTASGNGTTQFSNETTADNYTTDTNVFSGGLNLKWNHDNWHIESDLSMSRAASNEINVDTTADPYNGLGTSTPTLMAQSANFLLKGRSIGDLSFANPGIYTNLNDMGLSRYGVYPYIYHDRNKAFRTSVQYDLPNNPVFSAIEAGVYANNHTYDADREVYVYGAEWGQGSVPLTIPSADAQVTCWKGNFSGFPCFLALNGPAILASHGIVANPVKNITDQSWSEIQSGSVDEKTRDLFFMGDIDAQLGGRELTGNVGVRVSRQSQYSYGLQQVGNGAGIPITDGNGNTSYDYAPLKVGKTYTDYLPSLNLVYHWDDNDQTRFSAAKVLSRPPINTMLAGAGSWVSDGQYNVWGGTSPLLNPLRAMQYDLDYEHYFDDSTGAVTAGVFYKYIDSFIQNVTYNNYDFAAAGIKVPTNPATGQPYANGEFQTAYNAQGGHVDGVEMSYTKTHFLPGIWSGLGFDANAAFTASNVHNPTNLAGPTTQIGLPGLSKRVASTALFYDNGIFSARLSANYRSSFLSNTQIAVTNQLVTFASETVYDFQASYNVTKQLSVVFQLLNLSNQPTRTYFGGNPTQTGTVQYFGRTSYFGVNFKL
ncbi:MAG TPA: TonB-dependent receptor [Dyella sp.]|nr:TonB-dependent receptor [Dyella sp.]